MSYALTELLYFYNFTNISIRVALSRAPGLCTGGPPVHRAGRFDGDGVQAADARRDPQRAVVCGGRPADRQEGLVGAVPSRRWAQRLLHGAALHQVRHVLVLKITALSVIIELNGSEIIVPFLIDNFR